MAFPDVYIELVEAYPCASRDELNCREGHWIRNTPNCVNTNVAGRSDAEWRSENKETLREYFKQYDADRAEKRREYDANRREHNTKMRRENRAKKKLSAENNVLQVSGNREVVSAGEEVQGNLSE
jgi:hypothetical protein